MESPPETGQDIGTRQRYEELIREINYNNYRYHVLDDPLISDFEFDQLLIELRQIEEKHPDWVSDVSPTQRAGDAPVSKFPKVRHPAPVLSLGNAFSQDDVYAWFDRISRLDNRVIEADFEVEPKVDGLTVVLHYHDGRFAFGATRGDGEVGEDITTNLRTIKSLPLRIPISENGPKPPDNLVVRGEAFISLKDFKELNRRLEEVGQKTYLNPRNTAAGALRQLDPNLTASRPIRMLIYEIVEGSDSIPETQQERLSYLHHLGFPVLEAQYCKSLDEALAACEELAERRDQLAYEADGAVIKINDVNLARDLGVVGKDPRGAIAYKFPAREVTTQLMDIGVNVGRTGVLTPYAILDPVNIGGVIVKQATLHNFDYIAEKDIRIGDRVLVKRAGDVIPYIIGPVVAARTGEEKAYQPPSSCPTCGQAVQHLPGEVAWYCVNAACPAQLIRNLEHFVSRGAMDIVGLGIRIVVQLVEAGLVRDAADLYFLKREDLLTLEGFAEKKADNLLSSIEVSKERSLARLINALGIRGVGEVGAAELARHFENLDALAHATMPEIESIEGFGPNIAQSIVDWFARPSNLQVLNKLRTVGVWPKGSQVYHPARAILPFSGFTFVVTGSLDGFTRESVKDFIEEKGGKVTDSISKMTSFLVLGENPGSKLRKARDMGIPIIDENKLKQLADRG